MEGGEDFTDNAFRFHVPVVRSGVNVVDSAGEDALLDRIIHQVVCPVIRFAHITTIADGANLDPITNGFEILMVNFNVRILLQRPLLIPHGPLNRSHSLQPPRLHKIWKERVLIPLLILTHVLCKVGYLAFHRIYASTQVPEGGLDITGFG